MGIFHSKGGRGELGEVWKEKVVGREGAEERMLQTGIIRFLNWNMVKQKLLGRQYVSIGSIWGILALFMIFNSEFQFQDQLR